MAKCDQGYLCEVCGEPVPEITESDLYLRYVLGEIPASQLMTAPERHLRCNPAQAQFIVHADFPPVTVGGLFGKQNFDPHEVKAREELVTRAWLRLRELPGSGLPIGEYPLPEVRNKADASSEG